MQTSRSLRPRTARHAASLPLPFPKFSTPEKAPSSSRLAAARPLSTQKAQLFVGSSSSWHGVIVGEEIHDEDQLGPLCIDGDVLAFEHERDGRRYAARLVRVGERWTGRYECHSPRGPASIEPCWIREVPSRRGRRFEGRWIEQGIEYIWKVTLGEPRGAATGTEG